MDACRTHMSVCACVCVQHVLLCTRVCVCWCVHVHCVSSPCDLRSVSGCTGKDWAWIPAPHLPGCVTLGQLLDLSELSAFL